MSTIYFSSQDREYYQEGVSGKLLKLNKLHLTIQKKWFDMIESGEKLEEYRQDSLYWERRLMEPMKGIFVSFRDFDIIVFQNGYKKDSPRTVHLLSNISFGKPKDGWAPKEFLNQTFYVIRIGPRLEVKPLEEAVCHKHGGQS